MDNYQKFISFIYVYINLPMKGEDRTIKGGISYEKKMEKIQNIYYWSILYCIY